MLKTVEEIKDNANGKSIEIFVDGKRVNQSDFLSEIPNSIKETKDKIIVIFETE